jgi:hypothetical protein
MKSLKTFAGLFLVLLVIFLLFQRSTTQVKTIAEIPYNKDSARVHYISLKAAQQLTANFKAGKAALARQLKSADFLEKKFDLPIAEKFNRDAIAALLNHKGAKGIRIYFGQDDKGLIKMVLVAVDAQGNDIPGNGTELGYALDASLRCPTLCSFNSPLMHSPAGSK